MTGLLRGELIKLRTTRTAIGFAILVLILVMANVLIGALVGNPTSVVDKREVLSVAGLGGTIPIVLVIFGVVGATGEHRHGTITSVLLIAPHRLRATLARLLAYATVGALVALGVQAIALAVGLPLLAGQSGPDLTATDVLELAAGGIVACTLATALGVAVGALIRNQVAAVVGTLAYLFILEPIVGAVSDTLGRYTVDSSIGALAGLNFSPQLRPVYAGLVLLAWTVVIGALSALADRARDVN